jgi:beta-glucosidase
VRLNPGEKRHVVLSLNRRAFSYYDAEAKDWRVDPGSFEVYVGDSSDAIALKQELQM